MPSLSIKNTLYACCPRPLRPYWDHIESSELGYRLAKGAFWSLVGTAISRSLMLVASIIVARMLGKEVFGEFGIVRTTVGMFGVLAGFALGLTATKHVAEFRTSDPARAGHIIALSSLVAMCTGGLMALVLFAFAPWLAAYTLNAPHLSGLLRIGCLLMLLSVLNGAQTGALAGFEAFKTIARVNFFVGLASFPILVVGTYFGGLRGAVWGLTLNVAVHWALNHLALRQEAGRIGVPFGFTGCLRERRILWQFSLPATLNGAIISPVGWACIAMLVNQPGGYAEMGIYNAALAFRWLLLSAGLTLDAVLLPMMSSTRSSTNDRLDRVNILSSWLIGVLPALPLLCFPELAEMLFGKEYAGPAFSKTVCLVILFTCIMLYKQGLTRVLVANGMLWWVFTSSATWAVSMLVLAHWLVPFGAVGLSSCFLVASILNTVVFIPLYLRKNLIPRSTLVSKNSLIVWGLLLLSLFLGISGINVFVRMISLPFFVFLTVRSMSRSLSAPVEGTP